MVRLSITPKNVLYYTQWYYTPMASNFGHARAVNIQTWENLKQYGYTKL